MTGTAIYIRVSPDHDPSDVAELLDALASLLRDVGANINIESTRIYGQITGITANVGITWLPR